MNDAEQAKLEYAIREAHERGAFREAVKIAIAGYGPELYGFIFGLLRRRRDDTNEVFALFCDNVEKGLPGFKWRSTFRTWAYVLARNAILTFRRNKARERRRRRPLSDVCAEVLVHVSRISTDEWRKSSVQRAFRDLRRELSEEDQMILILRIDRRLSWEDVARVTIGNEIAEDVEALRKETNRVKVRFGRLKEQLREIAINVGLVKPKTTCDTHKAQRGVR